MKARRGVLGTLVMAGGDLCAMARTLCGRSTLLGKRGLNALGVLLLRCSRKKDLRKT